MVDEGRVIRLVRHGRAAAGWDLAVDPDLDDLGRAQAATLAAELASLGPLRIVTSPLRRCRATARVYADLVGGHVTVAPEVAEIPSPEGVEMSARTGWLREAMAGTWADLGPRYAAYRDEVVGYVRERDDATVVFSHFVAINAVIGACLADDRLVIRRLDNCSVTTVVADATGLTLVEGGHEADTLIR
jgi:broad specificity phosphatase PhoE